MHSSNSVMLSLLFSSFLVSLGLLGVRRHISERQGQVAHSAPFWFGLLALLLTWLLFVPVNVWAHLSGDSDSWIFGSENFDGGIGRRRIIHSGRKCRLV